MGFGADRGLQTVSPHPAGDLSDKRGCTLPLPSTTPAVTFPVAGHRLRWPVPNYTARWWSS